jgi:hypothetical protein
MHQLIRVEKIFLTKLLDDFLNVASNIDAQRETVNVLKTNLEEVMLKFDETSVSFYVDSNNSVPVNTNKHAYFTFEDYNKIKECYTALTESSENVFFQKNISLLNEAIDVLNDYYSFAINNDNSYLKYFGTQHFQDIESFNSFKRNHQLKKLKYLKKS